MQKFEVMKNIVLIITAILFLALAVVFFLKDQQPPPDLRPLLGKRIFAELEGLKKQNVFPPEVNSLKTIKIAVHTPSVGLKKVILKNIILPFEAQPEGFFSMQIDVLENLTPPEEAQLILQINLFENRSQNKIGEYGHTIKISKEELEYLQKEAAIYTAAEPAKPGTPTPENPGAEATPNQ